MTAVITTNVADAVSALNAGRVVAIPTETVYGLAARMDQSDAVRKVFDIKDRPHDHPLIVHDADLDRARRWARFNDAAIALARQFWPGPLTLLLPRTELVPDAVTGGRATVAIRVPAHPMALAIIDSVNYGIVAPSANKFGRVSPTTAQHVAVDLGNDIDLIVDGGACSIGVESTIVDCTTESPQILRPGYITRTQIEKALGTYADKANGESRAPGMLPSHYAPRCAVELFNDRAEAEARLRVLVEQNANARLLDRTSNLPEYARFLYADLRSADNDGVDVVVAVLPDSSDLGEAICDRLRKAAVRH